MLPVDVELHALQPHAHYRLRDVLAAAATLPDGTTRTLIQIADWDFRWQHVYRYRRPVALPKGTRVSMHYVYDNSAANPRNPQLPPQRVFWGQRSFDEMGDLWFQFVDQQRRRSRCDSTPRSSAKMTAEDIVGYETMLRVEPAATPSCTTMSRCCICRWGARRCRDVTSGRRRRSKPGRRRGALQSRDGALGSAAASMKRSSRYREALRLRPGLRGRAQQSGHGAGGTRSIVAAAVPHFRDGRPSRRGNVQAQRNLAWHLSTSAPIYTGGRRSHRSGRTRGRDAPARATAHMLDALAAAYKARRARLDKATPPPSAHAQTRQTRRSTSVLRERLALYQQGKPDPHSRSGRGREQPVVNE